MKRKAGLPEPFSSYASFTPLCSMVGMGVSSWGVPRRCRTRPRISPKAVAVKGYPLHAMERASTFDVAVIGGGPGGSSAATALARCGRRVLLLERDRFPRFHIGESQLPWINGVLEALGADGAVAKAGFVEKWGASFWEIDSAPAAYVDFTAAVETPVPQTYQVPRAAFDEVLLRHAERSGVIVREGCRALDAEFAGDGVTVRFAGPDGVEAQARVAVVVDASGRAGFLARRIGGYEN